MDILRLLSRGSTPSASCTVKGETRAESPISDIDDDKIAGGEIVIDESIRQTLEAAQVANAANEEHEGGMVRVIKHERADSGQGDCEMVDAGGGKTQQGEREGMGESELPPANQAAERVFASAPDGDEVMDAIPNANAAPPALDLSHPVAPQDRLSITIKDANNYRTVFRCAPHSKHPFSPPPSLLIFLYH